LLRGRLVLSFMAHVLMPEIGKVAALSIASLGSLEGTASINSKLINDSFSNSQHRNSPYWLTISWFGELGMGPRMRQEQSMAAQLPVDVGAFFRISMEDLCVH
jgi:hypothetical protein